jgi:hypothetical protein
VKTGRHLKGIAPPLVVQVAVRKLVDDQGEGKAMRRLGLSSQTLSRLAGGFPVQRASLAVARARLGIADNE